MSAGERLRAAMVAEKPLQLVGTVNAYSALLAREAGFRAERSRGGVGIGGRRRGYHPWQLH